MGRSITEPRGQAIRSQAHAGGDVADDDMPTMPSMPSMPGMRRTMHQLSGANENAHAAVGEASASAFWTWLQAAAQARHWDMKTLAERAGLSHTTLSKYHTQGTVPSDKSCGKIAEALGIRKSVVLGYAGHLNWDDVAGVEIDPQTETQSLLVRTDPESGETERLPLAVTPIEADPLANARQAIHMIPTTILGDQAKWNLTQLLDQLAVSTKLAAQLAEHQQRHSPPDQPPSDTHAPTQSHRRPDPE